MRIKIDQKPKWNRDAEGLWVSFLVPGEVQAYAMNCIAQMPDRPHSLEVKEYRKRRSLDANAYCWVLLDKLAQVTGIPKEHIYRAHIKEIGGNSETVCIPTRAVDRLREGWAHNGMGWVTDTMPSKLVGCTCVVLYYGSSSYDSGQMARLIDNIVQDCKEQGIETATPEELERLKEGWGK